MVWRFYLWPTILLLAGVLLLSALLGVVPAWLVSCCEFPGRRLLSWALVLPFAIPTYVAAYAYAGIVDYTGVLQTFLRSQEIAVNPRLFDVMNLPGAILILSMVLYPYVYVTARSSFAQHGGNLVLLSRSLGKSLPSSIWNVTIPTAWPAILAGLGLIAMEVLNEFGAMDYLGVDTFATGIFRAWKGQDDLGSAARLSACLLGAVALVAVLERVLRGRRRFGSVTTVAQDLQRLRLSGARKWAALSVCLVPLAGGFLLPVGQLTYWCIETNSAGRIGEFAEAAGRSLVLALGVALVTCLVAAVVTYAARLLRNGALRQKLRIGATVGYACPGAVVAIGVMLTLRLIDVRLFSTMLVGIAFAYIVRYLAVGFAPLDAGSKAVPTMFDDLSRALGAGTGRTLARIHVPLFRGPFLAAIVLVSVDLLKELPMTVMLSPPNFETLATKTYQLASEEMVADASIGALALIVVGLVPVLLTNKLSK
jgi:iron(III) transport system permease protein